MAELFIAHQFVVVVIGYKQDRDNVLSPDLKQNCEETALSQLMQITGFASGLVVPGKLRGRYLEQDGSSTGETYPINDLCPYKVLTPGGGDHYGATCWLDSAWGLVLRMHRGGKEVDEITQSLQREVERSFPLVPVVVTDIGDAIGEYPPNGSGFVDHSNDDDKLSTCIHVRCNGWVDRRSTTLTHDVLVCRSCHLRVPFLREVQTYGELREHFAQWNPSIGS